MEGEQNVSEYGHEIQTHQIQHDFNLRVHDGANQGGKGGRSAGMPLRQPRGIILKEVA